MSQVRGKINNPARAKQLHDFTGLRFKNITPTDIDGFVEFKDTLFVLMEAKFNGAELPYGQRLAIERLCKALQKAGKITAALVLTHNAYVDEEINFAGCVVSFEWAEFRVRN